MLKGRSWGLVVTLGLASALGCNAILGNEEGHLPSDEAGGDGSVSGSTGSGGKGTGGKSSGSGGVGTSTGGIDGAGAPGNEAGAGGEPSGGTGGAPAATGGKSGTGGTLGTGGKSGTGGAAKGGTGGVPSSGGTGPATGGTTGRGGTTSTGGGPTPPGGAPSTGGAGPAGCATTEPSSCTSPSSVRYCESGSYRTVSCATRCPEIGFDGTQAMCSSSVCMCGAGLDSECHQGWVNYCSCVAGGCTDEQALTIYVACYQGGPTELATRCWAYAPTCADGVNTCGS